MRIQEKLDKSKSESVKAGNFILGHEMLLALLLAVLIVVLSSVIGIENNKVAFINTAQYAHYLAGPHNILKFLANWDGADYLTISTQGYSSTSLTNFFPLYPLLIHIIAKVINSSLVSALIVAWAFLIGAIYYYLKIIKLYFKVTDNVEALKATLLFVLFPTSVYLIAAYTESLFAFLSLGAIYYALQRKYILTALFAMFATATHPNGIFLLLLSGLILIEEKERIRNVFITLIVGSLGLVSYMVFLLFRYHNPLEFLVRAQQDHGWFSTLLISRLGSFNNINFVFAIAVLLAAIYWWKRRKSFAIYSGLYLLIPLVGGQFGGFPRYSLVIFPLQFMIYEYFRDKKLAYQIIMIMFSVSWTYITLHYAAGYVVG